MFGQVTLLSEQDLQRVLAAPVFLRELAARYRSEYLLLYRHRFVDRSYTNAWGWLYLLAAARPEPEQPFVVSGASASRTRAYARLSP